MPSVRPRQLGRLSGWAPPLEAAKPGRFRRGDERPSPRLLDGWHPPAPMLAPQKSDAYALTLRAYSSGTAFGPQGLPGRAATAAPVPTRCPSARPLWKRCRDARTFPVFRGRYVRNQQTLVRQTWMVRSHLLDASSANVLIYKDISACKS